ncbi:hypothetical protein D3C73_1103260 [compost metagenome]
METRGNHRDPPIQPKGIQRRIDGAASDTAPGHADVGKGGKTLGCDLFVQQRVILAHQADKLRGKQILHLHFRHQRTVVADVQVDTPLA